MLINQITNDKMLKDFKTYVKTIPSAKLDKPTTRKIKQTAMTITNTIFSDALYFELQEFEIQLFKSILKVFGCKHHLAITAFVDNLASIDSVVTIKKACEDADFYEAYPSNNSLDDKIKLYVGYLKNSSGILDVDYAVKTIFS